MKKKNTTHYQHYNSQFRLKKWTNENNKTFLYSKSGKFLGEVGIGNNIGWEYDLYEPINNEYKINEIETDYFANNLEEKYTQIIDDIENEIKYFIDINLEKGLFEENNVTNYDSIREFIEISVWRHPNVVKIMNNNKVNKLDAYKWVQTKCSQQKVYYIEILYIKGSQKLLCPDIGSFMEHDETLNENYRFIFITPKIGIVSKIAENMDDCYKNIFIRPMPEWFIEKINNNVPEICIQRYVSQDKL